MQQLCFRLYSKYVGNEHILNTATRIKVDDPECLMRSRDLLKSQAFVEALGITLRQLPRVRYPTSSPAVYSRAGSQTSMVQHSIGKFPNFTGCSVLGDREKIKRLQLPCVLKQAMNPQSYRSSHQGGTYPLSAFSESYTPTHSTVSNKRCVSRGRALVNSLYITTLLRSSII